ncbi:MAG: ATP-dependent DNA helicase RecG [Armatimonadota bacterium]|nr:ATP-dependent DNA helicase RecG [Armatimonadota bacterium]MDR7532407.1 ATP-dependent DNA helicase RecG [Armatimonadota bacterium]MDR7535334.1 ATP-dependent DNA helicase RecG [Armatimonadota bacterium]
MTRRRTAPVDAPAVAGRTRRLRPDDAVQYLRGVGPARAGLLGRLGIETVRDLLLHLPRRHEDRRHPTPLALLREGVEQAAIVRIERVQLIRTRRGIPIVRAGVVDTTGAALAIWFHQPYLVTTLARGQQVSLYGRVERAGRGLQFVAPEFEILEPQADSLHIGRLVPIYPTTEGLPQRTLRVLVRDALAACADAVPDVLPADLRTRHGLPPLRQALWAVHFPDREEEYAAARRRLAFEELLVLRLGVLEQRRTLRAVPRAAAYGPPGRVLAQFAASLPYPLTGAQRRVIDEILRDLRGPVPMNRLLQGDVGAGKTVVAAAALVACVDGGYQGALMAPTEILAEQHYLTLRQVLAPLGVPVVLLTGGADAAVRQVALARLAAGEPLVAVGTHALLEEGVAFARLGLVVIDEQHRFGVMQRARLREKGAAPDVLVMTATPIPRTLTLTLYGDLDVSLLDELPPGRQPVATHVRPTAARAKVYAWLRQQVVSGRQAYVVCPLIEESEAVQAASATQLARDLREGPLAGVRLEVLHGRLPAAARGERMEAFRAGAIDVLVATTVIEVGIDVPNATIMVIENADRYGLAQLHQLRGRVGRGTCRGTCILLADPTTEEGRRRLDVMTATTDGFRIAQEDLAIRGPGEVLGTRQHGAAGLRVADLVADVGLLEEASAAAEALLARDPALQAPDIAMLAAAVRQRLHQGAGLASVG